MPTLTFREALNQAMTEEMERDDRVFLMGEEVAEYNGAYKVSQGMLAKFGPRRVVDAPISEYSIEGLARALADGPGGEEVTVVAERPDGASLRFNATVRIDTPQETRYYEHGGILPYVLRQLLSGRGDAPTAGGV